MDESQCTVGMWNTGRRGNMDQVLTEGYKKVKGIQMRVFNWGCSHVVYLCKNDETCIGRESSTAFVHFLMSSLAVRLYLTSCQG